MTEETTPIAPQNPQLNPYESNELGLLFESLAKAQMEMEYAGQNSVNPYFKSRYSDLASIVKSTRPALSKNGLCVVQRVLQNASGHQFLFTRLCHSSGQWMESKMIINPPKADIQSMGSFLTYLRRYNYSSIVGAISTSEDDDGEKAMDEQRKQGVAPKPSKIGRDQLKLLNEALFEHDFLLPELLAKAKIQKLSDLPSERFMGCMAWIEGMKEKKDEESDGERC